MPVAPLRLVRRCFEFAPQKDFLKVPRGTRGIYVLYRKRRSRTKGETAKIRYDVVYIGLASEGALGIRRRLRAHSRQKIGQWTHFSVYEVWDNIRHDEIVELEGSSGTSTASTRTPTSSTSPRRTANSVGFEGKPRQKDGWRGQPENSRGG